MKNNLKDNVISEALALWESGVPDSDIIARFPGERREIEGLLALFAALGDERRKAVSSEKLLRDILDRLPSVTDGADGRYNYREPKGRISFIDQIQDFMSRKVLVSAGVAALLLVVIASSRMRNADRNTPDPGSNPENGGTAQNAPVTGNVSDVLAALLQDASAERSSLDAAEEVSIATSDTEALSEFGQSYENEL